jgi:hypothetical protein
MEKNIKPDFQNYNLNIEIDYLCYDQKQFYFYFNYIKKKLQIKNSRKSKIDCLLKKCKGKFCKAIHDYVKLCLNICLQRLPQKFITNIKIDYNKQLMSKKIIDIYNNFNLLPSIDDKSEKNYIKNNKENLYKILVNETFRNLYQIYLESERYQRDLENIKKCLGKRIGILYNFVAKNFCVYYDVVTPKNLDNNNFEKKKLFIITNCDK